MPGIGPIAGTTILSAGLCSLWLLSAGTSVSAPKDGGGVTGSKLALVGQSDITGALTTLDGPPAFQTQFKSRPGQCSVPLAWITLSRTANLGDTTVRLKSGNYFSPVFKLTDRPVRVAIPYPASYAVGHGTLMVLHAGGDITLSLAPPWHLSAQATSVAHEVTWSTSEGCRRSNG
jgi:hypothetical protein